MRSRVRGWRWRRNPLRRRSDVVEAWWAVAVGVLLLVGAPLVGAGVARWTYEHARAHAEAARATRHHVRAVLVKDSPRAVPSASRHGLRPLSTPVRWTGSDGTARTALIDVPAGLRRGTRIDVWTDRHGAIVPAAPSSGMILQQALAMGVFTGAAAVFTVSVAHVCVSRRLVRRRLDQWASDWARTEPDWTRRTA